MYAYPVICKYTGEIIKEFPFPHLRDEYTRKHNLSGCVYSPLDIRLSYTAYEELEIDYRIALIKSERAYSHIL